MKCYTGTVRRPYSRAVVPQKRKMGDKVKSRRPSSTRHMPEYVPLSSKSLALLAVIKGGAVGDVTRVKDNRPSKQTVAVEATKRRECPLIPVRRSLTYR